MFRVLHGKGFLIGFLLSLFVGNAQAYTVTTFTGAVFDPDPSILSANVGVSGFDIENFEDAALISGLAVSSTNTNIFTFPVDFSEGVWDGVSHLGVQNNFLEKASVSFSFLNGLSSFGLGLIAVNHGQEILVNGTTLVADITADPNFGFGGLNLYLRLDREVADAPITSVEFRQTVTSSQDGFGFDHLAAQTVVPVPGAAWLMMSGLVMLLGASRRRQR